MQEARDRIDGKIIEMIGIAKDPLNMSMGDEQLRKE